jgi:glycosyltransferase involved in cell wall biosynthesis
MVVMSESTAWDEPRFRWKEWIKRRLVALYSSALVGGQSHRDYLIKLGLLGERIFLGYDAVDNIYFSDQCAAISSRREEVRQQYGLPPAYFLASARFVEKKNLPRLLQAYARYRAQCQTVTPWSLVVLGDGNLRRDLELQLDTLNLRDYVQMPGFKQYADLPAYYALASAFIHPSTVEPWGLVVNEAMACGLPVLVSNQCGCAPELVRDGVNGFTFNPLDVEEIAQKMLRLTNSPALLPALGQASREIIAQWSPQRFADGLTQALALASSTPFPRPGWSGHLLLRILLRR